MPRTVDATTVAANFFFPESYDVWAERPLVERLRRVAMLTEGLDRRRREYRQMGWVYAMRNSAFKAVVFKVGLSRRFPTARALELTRSTGVFGCFELIYFVHVGDCHAAEAEAHRLLAPDRVSRDKEFFQASLGRTLEVMDMVATRYPVWMGRREPRPLAQPFFMVRIECPSCRSPVLVREVLIPVRPRCRTCGADVVLTES